MPFVRLIAALLCGLLLSACSSVHESDADASLHPAVVSRVIPDARLVLTPGLAGGSAGLNMTLAYTTRKGDSGIGTGRPTTTTGPIFHEGCSESKRYVVTSYIAVLTRRDVASVAVVGGAPIPTESNSTLPDGLRGAAIELPGYRIAEPFSTGYPWSPCPRVIGFDANGKQIDEQGRIGKPLDVELPSRHWQAPARPTSGVCGLTATRLPRETKVLGGTVAARLRPLPDLPNHAFISCAETTYIYMDEHEFPAAVLLDAVHPGAEMPALPGMEPLAGHPGIFEMPPDRFARRVRGAWVAVQEEEGIGPSVPIDLLEHLRASVTL